ncbi:MAG: type II toxin-antitoxin system VapC family toxin [Actinobacteria bacterium]|nr:type II toxin-antitoxin system VapC family toxin [Actinomycetota bacterium]MBT3688343.1 type II toxin-antitoxin system VapC family toxin [Actinomycetota bacterium]MBT4037241.1 type II toxin-antitoxin system VapC family toxin [Actinomycetota bacterium]MBT4278759.1 type II toxin-antitoxin system VapC family toxin [Actinomycetota bacterium]MBT4343913.1 type II toxin-antitoxin system VapC family toxin [Actinomycetota bacterium]
MTLYVDSSALIKRYLKEDGAAEAVAHMASDPVLVTSALTAIEVRRNLTRILTDDLEVLRARLVVDLDAFAVIPLDAQVCAEAARIAEKTLCRSLDSIHLAAARRAGSATTVLTFDQRQAEAARSIGLSVIGC